MLAARHYDARPQASQYEGTPGPIFRCNSKKDDKIQHAKPKDYEE
jgi:hypothetical protein